VHPPAPCPTRWGPRYRESTLRVPWGLGTLVQPTVAARAAPRPRGSPNGRKPVPPQSVTITEAARRLGVSTKTVRRRIADGSLLAHKASGPGGFVYRVTDPSVLVVQPGLDAGLDTRARADAGAGQQVGRTLLELASRVAAAEVRAARAEWERDALRAENESLRRALPTQPPAARAPRRWWPLRWRFGWPRTQREET
jgi:excisionase family DNA binding protein